MEAKARKARTDRSNCQLLRATALSLSLSLLKPIADLAGKDGDKIAAEKNLADKDGGTTNNPGDRTNGEKRARLQRTATNRASRDISRLPRAGPRELSAAKPVSRPR